MAGHETTATSLAWAFYHLLRHPDVVARLRDELHAVLGDGPMEPEHVGRLEYLDAVLKETQRLTPVIGIDRPRPRRACADRRPSSCRREWSSPRRSTSSTGDRRRGPSPSASAPSASSVSAPARSPSSRSAAASVAASVRRSRTYEMKVVLSEVVRRADLRVAPGYRMRTVQRAITHAPSAGMPVVMDARR